jgi:hypothetical protein
VSRTEIYCCSTLLSLATALAWQESHDGAPQDGRVRRVLLVSDYRPDAEAGTPLLRRDGARALAERFDLVVDVNELLAPYHPASFDPGRDAASLLGRLLAAEWGAGDHVQLVVEPIQVAFARWLLRVLPDAQVTVVADGLMAYGPSRGRVPHSIARRITGLVHLDLVPGLSPVYLSEHCVPTEPVSGHRLREVLDGCMRAAEPAGRAENREALVLGQYLSQLAVVTEEEEQGLYLDAVVLAAGWTDGRVAFKPHPAASPLLSGGLRAAAVAKGIDLAVLPATGPAEALFAGGRYAVVVGCFSTGLFTASSVYGLRAVSIGTELLLERLRPYQNGNRIPVTLADALLRPAPEAGPGEVVPLEQVGELVQAVAYCMQADRYPHLRQRALATLASHPRRRDRYVKRRRLETLGLVTGAGTRLEPTSAHEKVLRSARQAMRRTLPESALRAVRRVRASR